jgi:tetratricopeptide (TPR) repeat protein
VYDRDLGDVSALQAHIAQTIAHEVGITISTRERARLARRPSVNRSAYEEYLRGLHSWNKRTPRDISDAIAHFENAIDFDAAYAPAYAGLADAYNQLGTHLIGDKPPRETRPLAIAAAKKAIEIDDELAEAHAALGFAKVYDWDWPQAEKELERAIELNPGYGPVRTWYASYLQQHLRHREAVTQARYALELDPLSLIVRTQVGWIYTQAGKFDKGIPYFRDVLERDPDYLWAQWMLGMADSQTGRHTEAIAVLEKAATRSHRTPAIIASLGRAYALAGRKRDAKRLLDELFEVAKTRYVSPHAFTEVYLGLGDHERAFEWMEREYEDRSNSVAWFGTTPMFDPLRSDPRFIDLLHRINLADLIRYP